MSAVKPRILRGDDLREPLDQRGQKLYLGEIAVVGIKGSFYLVEIVGIHDGVGYHHTVYECSALFIEHFALTNAFLAEPPARPLHMRIRDSDIDVVFLKPTEKA